jgi:hypothetical protein
VKWISYLLLQGSDEERHKKKKKDKAMLDLGTPRDRPRVSSVHLLSASTAENVNKCACNSNP